MIREHRKKLSSGLGDFSGWVGERVRVNLLKRKILDTNVYFDNVEWNSEKLYKMISADVKTNVK